MANLRVELYGHLVGHLVGKDWRTFDFATDRRVFEKFELGSTVLSESVPLDVISNRVRLTQLNSRHAESATYY